jgi:hypothetical protein
MEQAMVRLEPETRATDNPSGDEDAMATAEERMAILRMIEQGKITAEDGARLLAALGEKRQGTPPPRPGSPPRSAIFDTSRGLRIRVYDLFNNQAKVNVSVPVGLFRLIQRFIPASAGVDLAQIEQAIESGAIGRIVEVVDNEGGTRVEIGIE